MKTTEVIQSTIDKVLERVDALAGKLGIASTAVWSFTVKANIVNAWRDIASHAALMLLPIVLLCWSGHVMSMNLPHEKKIDQVYVQPQKFTCPQGSWCTSYGSVERVQGPDGDLANAAWVFIISGIVCAIVALFIAVEAVGGFITAISRLYTAEYDAYKDLIYDWKD